MEELLNIIYEKRNVLLICQNSLKKKLLKSIDKLINITFKTPKEAQNDLLGYYDDIAVYEIKRLLNTSYEYAQKVLNYLTITKDPFLQKSLQKYYHEPINYNKEIIVCTKIDMFLNKALENRQFTKYEKKEIDNISVFHYKTVIKEVEALAHKIVQIKEKGEMDIVVYYNNNCYVNIINDVFPFYGIGFNIDDTTNLYSIPSAQEVLNDLNKINDITDSRLKNKVIEAVNSLSNYAYNKEDLIDCFKNTSIKKENIKDAVDIMKYNKFMPYNKYTFILGMNYSIIPSIKKDDDYLSDKEKEKYALISSTEENKREIEYFQKTSKQCDNLFISYSDIDLSTELTKSPLINETELSDTSYEFSIKRAKLEFSKEDYSYMKYQLKNDNYANLLATFRDIEKYDNDYKQIDKELIKKEVLKDNILNVSFTKLDNFLSCPFKFFSKYMLKLDRKDHFVDIGNFFHVFLENYFISNDFDNSIAKGFEEIELSKFYKEKYYYYSKKLVEALKEQVILYDELFLEKEINKSLEEDKQILLVGKIDKLFIKDGYAFVVDYKTSTDSATLTKELKFKDSEPKARQLVFYFLLLDNQFGGMFLQHVMPKKAEDLKKEKFYKLDGYINTEFDDIKKLMTNDKKTLSQNDFNGIKNTLIEELKDFKEKALNGDFSIKPRDSACAFCPYKGFCYYKTYEEE